MEKYELNAYLSPIAAKYLAEVVYSLDYGETESTTEQDAINHILEEMAMYESIMEDQITRWMADDYPEKYKQWMEKQTEKTYGNTNMKQKLNEIPIEEFIQKYMKVDGRPMVLRDYHMEMLKMIEQYGEKRQRWSDAKTKTKTMKAKLNEIINEEE